MHKTESLIIIATGAFDPLHKGHIEYLNEAQKLGNRLVVAIESNLAVVQKKGTYLLSAEDRSAVIESLSSVDEVIITDDYNDTVSQLRKTYPLSTFVFVFGYGQTDLKCPEVKDHDVQFLYNVGGDKKINSSSKILRRYSEYVKSISELESGPYNGRYR